MSELCPAVRRTLRGRNRERERETKTEAERKGHVIKGWGKSSSETAASSSKSPSVELLGSVLWAAQPGHRHIDEEIWCSGQLIYRQKLGEWSFSLLLDTTFWPALLFALFHVVYSWRLIHIYIWYTVHEHTSNSVYIGHKRNIRKADKNYE